MDIGIFGAFLLLLLIGWLPVVVILLLLSVLAATVTYAIAQHRISRQVILSRYFALAAVVFTPCQISVFLTAFYAANPSEMSWLMTAIYSVLGVILFSGLSWKYFRLSHSTNNSQ